MTALKQYQRLETIGIWHASPTDQRRDVIVQLGEATLTISDSRMTPLSHWSLPAVRRLNPEALPAEFGPGPDMPEVLEIEDQTMVVAIEKVLAALRRRRAQPRRLRRALVLGGAGAALIAGALWLPGALIRQAVAVVPPAKRAEMGEALLADIRRSAGAPCEDALARRALDRLRARLVPDRQGRLVVLREWLGSTQYLPGGIILIGRHLIEDTEDPAVLAGHVLAADAGARLTDPLRRLLRDAGVLATLQLLATGTLPEASIARHAETVLTMPLPPVPAADLAARFRAAAVAPAPYVATLGGAGTELAAEAAVSPGAARPVMSDGDWVSLQQICTG